MAKKKVGGKKRVSKKNDVWDIGSFSERKELLLRILIGIVYGFVLSVWRVLVIILSAINWIIVLVSGKRDKNIAEFCEYWNSEKYRYLRYLTMVSNERPFPFTDMKRLSRFRLS